MDIWKKLKTKYREGRWIDGGESGPLIWQGYWNHPPLRRAWIRLAVICQNARTRWIELLAVLLTAIGTIAGVLAL